MTSTTNQSINYEDVLNGNMMASQEMLAGLNALNQFCDLISTKHPHYTTALIKSKRMIAERLDALGEAVEAHQNLINSILFIQKAEKNDTV